MNSKVCTLLQDMYQYVLSKDVFPPFSLYTSHPRCLLCLNQETVAPYDDTLIIVALEDKSYDQTVLDALTDGKVNKSQNTVVLRIIIRTAKVLPITDVRGKIFVFFSSSLFRFDTHNSFVGMKVSITGRDWSY